MTEFYAKRMEAIKRYFGNVTREDWPKTEHHVWYSYVHDKCIAEEPPEETNHDYVLLSKHTCRVALFGVDLD
jgi:hypothetical protein